MLDRGFLKGLMLGIILMYANMQMFMFGNIQPADLPQSQMSDSNNAPTPKCSEQTPVAKASAKTTTTTTTATQMVLQNHTAPLSEETILGPKIPHRIIITHKYKTLEEIPEPYLSNIKHTIQQYETLWNEMDVWYLNDDDCQAVTEKVDMRLLKYFWFETRGAYKSDMCRYAALYMKGGYYFDNDMQVVQPVKIAPHTTFVSPFEWGFNLKGQPRGLGLFNSFIAISPGHPILKRTFDLAVEYYDKGRRFGSHMGTGALFNAYTSLSMEEKGMVDMALAETQLSKFVYPDFPRLDGVGCCCDMVVHNTTDRQVYFYSHMVGDKGKITCGAKA